MGVPLNRHSGAAETVNSYRNGVCGSIALRFGTNYVLPGGLFFFLTSTHKCLLTFGQAIDGVEMSQNNCCTWGCFLSNQLVDGCESIKKQMCACKYHKQLHVQVWIS